MKLSAVIAGLDFLPSGMVVWLSTDSQYVQKGTCEWMPKWKRNGWMNSKKAGVANKSPWIALEAAVARHRHIEFTWVKAHSGLLHNEIADTLATRGAMGSTYCPTNRFDVLPADTEEEDDPAIPSTEVIAQTDEFGADDEHLPSFGAPALVFDFNDEEAAELEEELERGIRQFAHDMLGNSSEDEGFGETGGTVVISHKMTVVDDGSEPPLPEPPAGTAAGARLQLASWTRGPGRYTRSGCEIPLEFNVDPGEGRSTTTPRSGGAI
jgi:hypothetical protein